MRGRSAATVVLLAAGLQACATPPPESAARGDEGPECHEGTLGLLPGPDPVPVLTREGLRLVLIAGDARVPGALEGATLEVCGAVEGTAGEPYARLVVASFDLVAIDGSPAVLGTLASRDGALMLVRGDSTWLLSGPIEDLRGWEGERVWVSGAFEADRIRVTSYGWVP